MWKLLFAPISIWTDAASCKIFVIFDRFLILLSVHHREIRIQQQAEPRLHQDGDHFPALATEIRSTSAYSSTALITAVRKIRNCVFSAGVFSRIKDIYTSICDHRPVVVFTASVDSLKWFLMKEAYKSMLVGNFLHYFHC